MANSPSPLASKEAESSQHAESEHPAATLARGSTPTLTTITSARPPANRVESSRGSTLSIPALTSAATASSASSALINIGASTSTAADGLTSLSVPASNSSSSSSTRSTTPLPQPTFSVAHGTITDPAGSSPTTADENVFSSHRGSRTGGVEGENVEEATETEGITMSSSVHALDLLHKVNNQAAERDRDTLRTRYSKMSFGRANTSHSIKKGTQTRPLIPANLRSISAPDTSFDSYNPTQSEIAQAQESKGVKPQKDVLAMGDDSTYPDRKYFILSSAGKPIYISHTSPFRQRRPKVSSDSNPNNGDNKRDDGNNNDNQEDEDEEDESSTTQVGVMQALISIFADEESDKIRYIRQGSLLIVFLLRAPLYLVCVSSWSEEASTLRQQLDYLYLQVISLVSASQLTRLFSRMPNFDLRRLLEGTEGIFDHLVNQLNANESDQAPTDWASCHQWWLQALQPIRITIPDLRDQLTAALQPPPTSSSNTAQLQRPKDLLYVLLVANGRIVTLLRPKKHSVHPTDLLLLVNMVMGSASIKKSGTDEEAELWLPLSLPKFAPQGFVHAYVKFLSPHQWTKQSADQVKGVSANSTNTQLATIVVTADKEAFPTVQAWISGSLLNSSSSPSDSEGSSSESRLTTFQTHVLTLYKHLSNRSSDPTEGPDGVSAFTCADLGLAGLRHFVYRSNTSIQLTSPVLPEPYSNVASERKRLFTLYSLLHHHIHNPEPPASSNATINTAHAAQQDPNNNLASTFGLSSSSSTFSNNNGFKIPDKRLKMQLLKTPNEQVLGWITNPFELYLCVNPQLNKNAIVSIANSLTKWIKQNEKHLFLVNAGTF